MRLEYVPRDEFLENRFDYSPGDHLNVVSPTGAGKSHLLYQLAQVTLPRYPDIRFASFMPKPKDETTRNWMERLELEETEIWPPRRKLFSSKPAGHVFWPKHIKNDEAANRENLSSKFRGAINDLYINGPSISFIDDAYLIGVMYGLNTELDRHWVAGRSMGAGLWTSLQKPSGTLGGAVSSFAYDSPNHMFFGRDNDDRNLKRIAEIAISQLDPNQIREIVRNLRVHRIGSSAVSEMLYIDRRGPYSCIVGV